MPSREADCECLLGSEAVILTLNTWKAAYGQTRSVTSCEMSRLSTQQSCQLRLVVRCDQLSDFCNFKRRPIEFIGLRGEVHDHLRLGDIVRLTNFPCDQNQSCNDADYADDLCDVTPVLVLYVLDVRSATNTAIVAQVVWTVAFGQEQTALRA